MPHLIGGSGKTAQLRRQGLSHDSSQDDELRLATGLRGPHAHKAGLLYGLTVNKAPKGSFADELGIARGREK